MKRKRYECFTTTVEWRTLAEDPLVIICSYCDLNDVMSLRCSSSFFRSAARKELNNRKVLHFSALASRCSSKKDSNGIRRDYDDNQISQIWKKDKEDECVNAILNDTSKINVEKAGCCRRMDFANLSSIHIINFPQNLVRGLLVLDLTNCKSLDPQVLVSLNPNVNTHNSRIQLRELYLTGCRQFNRGHIHSLVKICPDLMVLHLSGCSQTIDDSTLKFICFHLTMLESLDLLGLNKIKHIFYVFQHLKKLKHLNINHCEKIDMSFLRHQCIALKLLVQGSSKEELFAVCKDAASEGDMFGNRQPSYLSDLEVADISFGTSVRGGAPAYSLASFALASRGKLREVNVSGSRIVDDDIKILLMTCTKLKSLEIRCCDNIHDLALEYIANYGKQLCFLDFSACFYVTDEGVAQLAKCSNITSLKMSSIHSLTDKSIIPLHQLRKLILLNVNSCINITTTAIKTLLRECLLLVEVDARNIGGIRNEIKKDDRRNLSIFNGKRCKVVSRSGILRCCSVIESSQRTSVQQGVIARRMYHCTQCNLLPRYKRGTCLACSERCHQGHAGVYLGAMTYFYCDCAFGFQPNYHCTALRCD